MKLKFIFILSLIFHLMSCEKSLKTNQIMDSENNINSVPFKQGIILNGSINSNDIYLIGTEKYENKIHSFYITREEAAEKIVKYKHDVPHFLLVHYIVIDDCYVFSKGEGTGIRISGIYVNGYTGEVEEKLDTSYVISPSMQKQLWGRDSIKDGYILKVETRRPL